MRTPKERPRGGHPRSRPADCASLVVLMVLLVAGCDLVERDDVTASSPTGPLPPLTIVVDTDMLPDDWLGLLYLASEPSVEIRAVTVAGGSVVGCTEGVAIARDLLADVGKANVPVACGPPSSPGGRPFPADWAEETKAAATGIGWTATDGDPTGSRVTDGDAVTVLRSAIDHEPITIVSLGPPTNIARLLDDPSWDRTGIHRIVQMAGAVDVAGNVDALPTVEWNAAVDPTALASVLSSGIEILLVTLDGTRFVPVRGADIDRMSADRSTRAADLAAKVLETQRSFAESGGYYLWDTLASVTARRSDVARVETIPLRVSLDPSEAGRTIRDPAGRPTLVTMEADAEGFERIFLDALLDRTR